jgi:hypothetical protein
MGINMTRWGTVAEAVTHFGITRQRVHQLLKKGALGQTKLLETPRGSVWLIEMPFRRQELVSGFHAPGCECRVHPQRRGCRE